MIVERAEIKFTGDSGDGMQLIGKLFAYNIASMGNVINTFPDFPVAMGVICDVNDASCKKNVSLTNY